MRRKVEELSLGRTFRPGSGVAQESLPHSGPVSLGPAHSAGLPVRFPGNGISLANVSSPWDGADCPLGPVKGERSVKVNR